MVEAEKARTAEGKAVVEAEKARTAEGKAVVARDEAVRSKAAEEYAAYGGASDSPPRVSTKTHSPAPRNFSIHAPLPCEVGNGGASSIFATAAS